MSSEIPNSSEQNAQSSISQSSASSNYSSSTSSSYTNDPQKVVSPIVTPVSTSPDTQNVNTNPKKTSEQVVQDKTISNTSDPILSKTGIQEVIIGNSIYTFGTLENLP